MFEKQSHNLKERIKQIWKYYIQMGYQCYRQEIKKSKKEQKEKYIRQKKSKTKRKRCIRF